LGRSSDGSTSKKQGTVTRFTCITTNIFMQSKTTNPIQPSTTGLDCQSPYKHEIGWLKGSNPIQSNNFRLVVGGN
jgi:hypothetical protein